MVENKRTLEEIKMSERKVSGAIGTASAEREKEKEEEVASKMADISSPIPKELSSPVKIAL